MHSCKNEVCVLNVKILTKNKQTMPKGVVSGGWPWFLGVLYIVHHDLKVVNIGFLQFICTSVFRHFKSWSLWSLTLPIP